MTWYCVIPLFCWKSLAARRRRRDNKLWHLSKLQKIKTATTTEVLNFIESHDLYESGCGAVDISLLASVLISRNAKLWTLDKKLHVLAIKTKVAFEPLTQ